MKEFRTAGERLREARKQRYKTARLFAEKSGTNAAVYYQHEAGIRPLTDTSAYKYANYLGVTPAWLLFGDASQTSGYCRIIGTIGANAEVTLFDNQDLAALRAVPSMNEELEVLEVSSDENGPFVTIGDLVYFAALTDLNPIDLQGTICVVQTDNGRVLVREVVSVDADGYASVRKIARSVSPNEPPERLRLRTGSPIEQIRKARSVPELMDRIAA